MTHLKASAAGPSLIDRLDGFISARWDIQILRVLATGPARFSRLRRAIPQVSANVLVVRLRQMEVMGLIQRAIMPEPADCQVYHLITAGLTAKVVIKAMEIWADEVSQVGFGNWGGERLTSLFG